MPMPSDPVSSPHPDMSLAAKVHWLKQPATYPHTPTRIDTIETHMSWVFLADEYVYKLKKPVRYSFLDFSTVEARRRDCEAELRLNRRLAPDVYLDVVPLILGADGNARLGGVGQVLDWLVHMRRLPADRMLDHAIRHHAVDEDALRRAALRLADFYKGSPPIRMEPSEYRRRFDNDIRDNLLDLTQPRYGMPMELCRRIASAQILFLQQCPELLDERVRAGRIIEAHGDLRPEHVCLRLEPVFIDCLEFNREFRILDAADELAFLAMECERLGAPDVGQVFLDTYRHVTGDHPPEDLLHFYKSYRACLRAKIAVWHLDDPTVAEPAKWSKLGMDYLRLADDYMTGDH